jgi:transcriptional regulator with XRE-family HTH domain
VSRESAPILAPAHAAAILRSTRRHLRLSQQELAKGLGVGALAVVNWESGRDTPALGNLVRWAEALGYAVAVERPERGAGAPVLVPKPGEALEDFRVRCLTAGLVDARVRLDRTQKMVGAALGVGAWSVHMWERSYRVPRLPRLIAWCEYLDCRLTIRQR